MTNEGHRLKKILAELNLPEGQWALSGSGVLVLHGIERDRPMGDVDIFLATRPWFELYHEGLMGIIRPDSDVAWHVWTTPPDDPKRRMDPPYLYKHIHGIEVNIFFEWRKRGIGDIDSAFWLCNTEIVGGVPCVPIQFLLEWKEQVGRGKDQTDIERIKEYLERRSA